MIKPVLLGESPSRNGDSSRPLSGPVARTLLNMMDVSFVDDGNAYDWLTKLFDCENASPEHVASWSRDDTYRARYRWAGRLKEWIESPTRLGDEKLIVVCLGRHAAESVSHELPWFEWLEYEIVEYVAIPHPSGLNRLYNDPETRRRAGETLVESLYRADPSSRPR